uniref:AlNc14C331G10694 protein n=1 Tax=Albugo laibachii Nc14 TaxID=890382 RepID=F0WWT1_9STRA|nr:AlNc14C331G10694 [Albugo laibachii Nc14]|eukprot:CCA25908.1 AlNc14C331G10694 [Albugo laibachii Nc14]
MKSIVRTLFVARDLKKFHYLRLAPHVASANIYQDFARYGHKALPKPEGLELNSSFGVRSLYHLAKGGPQDPPLM